MLLFNRIYYTKLFKFKKRSFLLENFKVSLVLFFSFILLFSIYSNITNQADAVTTLFNREYVTTNQFVESYIIDLNFIFFCDDSSGIGDFDFFEPFSEIYILPYSQFLNLLKTGQGASSVPLPTETPISKDYPRIVGSNELDPEILASHKQLIAGSDKAVLVYDHCQDKRFHNKEDTPSITFPINQFQPFTMSLEEYNKLAPLSYSNLKSGAGEKRDQADERYEIWKYALTALQVTIGAYIATKQFENPFAAFLYGVLTGAGVALLENIKSRLLAKYDNLKNKYDRIQKDPPDLNYTNLKTLIGDPAIISSINSDIEIKSLPLIIKHINDISNEASIADALVKSIERYDGAALNNDVAWTLIHANQIKDHSLLLKDQLMLSSATNELLIDSINHEPLLNDTQFSTMKSIIDELKTKNIDPDIVRELKNFGYTDKDISQATTQLLSLESFIS